MEFTIDQNMMGLLIAKYHSWDDKKEYEGQDTIFKALVKMDGNWHIVLNFPVFGQYKPERLKMNIKVKNGEMDGYRRGDNVVVHKLGLIKLGPNTWRLDPAIVTPVIKGYVILTNVPEPAPWESTAEETALKMYYDETKIHAVPHKVEN